MEGADRGSIEPQKTTALEHAIDDGVGEVFVVQHATPRFQRFVGGEDHRTVPPMALVDDVEEHVRRVGAVREVAHFIDDEDSGMRVRRQRVRQLAGTKGRREIVDEGRRRREEGIEAVLNRPIGDRNRQVGFSAARFAGQNQRATLRHKIGSQGRAQHVQSQGGLVGEIEIVDRLQKRKMCAACQPREPRLLSMRDLFGGEQRQEIAVGPRLPLRALDQVAPHTPGVCQMQSFEEGVEIRIVRHHDRPPTRREDAAVLDRVQRLRCAPPLRAPAALWTRPVRGSV